MKAAEIISLIDKILSDEKKFRKIVDDAFAFMDKDKNGQLDTSEIEDFIDYMIEEMKVPMEPDPELISNVMKTFDTDKSGTISKEELYPALKALIIEWREYLKDI